ncbi:MAG: N-6 DNA methylase, partial [Candidatus Anstonellales archaeon]
HKDAKNREGYFSRSPDELVFELYSNGQWININWSDFIVYAKRIAEEKLDLNLEIFTGLLREVKTLFYDKLLEIFRKHKENIREIYKSYRKELDKIYPKLREEKAEELYILHTVLNATALSVIGEQYIEEEIEIKQKRIKKGYSLPFLNWHIILERKGFLTREEIEILDDFYNAIESRVSRFNYKNERIKDLFRLLYEELISEEDRRALGEYYTPTWFAKWCMDRLEQSLWIEKLVIDPCCGTGTFLIEAFYRKVKAGKDPDNAIQEVVGFDINPLAVVLARAGLFIAYRMAGGYDNNVVPYVFYADSSFYSYDIIKKLKKIGIEEDYVDSVQALASNLNRFSMLPLLESTLEEIFDMVDEKTLNIKDITERENEILNLLIKKLSEVQEQIGFDKLSVMINKRQIAKDIARHGDGIWALLVVSSIAKHMIGRLQDYAIATNPPWINLSRLKGINGIIIKNFLRGNNLSGRILTGGDLSGYFVCKYGTGTNVKGIFIVPSSIAYSGTYGVGSLMVWKCLEKKPFSVYVFSNDVFKHGIPPGVIVVGEGSKEVYQVSLEGSYYKTSEDYTSKDIRLNQVSKDQVEKSVETLGQIAKSEGYEKPAFAERVKVNGVYIRGLKGGIKKRGAIKYAGLILTRYNPNTGIGRLEGMNQDINLNVLIPDRKGVSFNNYIKRVFYADRVLPFKLLEAYPAIISPKDKKDLIEFLYLIIMRNKANLSGDELAKINELRKEVQQSEPEFMKKGKFYVIHRVVRIFSSAVFECPEDNLYLADSTLCWMEFSNKETAYYYSGIINYLIHKVGTHFARNIHSRVLRVIDMLNLHYAGYYWNIEVATLSENLHNIMKSLPIKDNNAALKELSKIEDWKELLNLIDRHIDKSRLENTIKLLRERQ